MVSTLRNLFAFLVIVTTQSFAQEAIDRTEIVSIGGIRQYIRIKGKDKTKPILLFLHGGPGGSLLSKAGQISGKLQEHFIVVHWDQRETGETLKLNKSPQPLTLALFYNDTHDLIDTLLHKFERKKLYLAGYSWGTALGFHIADKYPTLLYAYIAISPIINQWKSDSLALSMLKETMGTEAQAELSQVNIPFANWEQLYYHRKWLFVHKGVRSINRNLPKRFVQTWAETWFKVFSEACYVNLFESLKTINCPIYFFAGEKDYQTNFAITKEYFAAVSAARKDLFLFPNAGHELPETDSRMFQDMVIEKILPATFNALNSDN